MYQLQSSEPRLHTVEMYSSAITTFGLVTTLTFDLWPWEHVQRCPLTLSMFGSVTRNKC